MRAGFGEYLTKLIIGIGRQDPDIEIVEVNTDIDHVHILLSIPPKLSVSDVVRMIKAKTGAVMRKRFPFLDKVYWGTDGIWSIGYFVSTTGINEEVVRKYIKMQGEEDSGQAKLEFQMLRVKPVVVYSSAAILRVKPVDGVIRCLLVKCGGGL